MLPNLGLSLQVRYSFYIILLPADLLSPNTYKAFHPPSPTTAYWVFTIQLEEEKLKYYITSCSFCLCNSACSLQSGSCRSHSLRKWGLTVLGTGASLTHPCPALCNCPAPANLLNHACPCKGQASPSPS